MAFTPSRSPQGPAASPFANASGHKPLDHYEQPFPKDGQWLCEVNSWDCVFAKKSAEWVLYVALKVNETIVQPPGLEVPVRAGKWTRGLKETIKNSTYLWGEINKFLVSVFRDERVIDCASALLDRITQDPKFLIGAPIVVRSFETIDEKQIDPKTMQPRRHINLDFEAPTIAVPESTLGYLDGLV